MTIKKENEQVGKKYRDDKGRRLQAVAVAKVNEQDEPSYYARDPSLLSKHHNYDSLLLKVNSTTHKRKECSTPILCVVINSAALSTKNLCIRKFFA